MKILQINKYLYYRGGAETVFFNTCKLLEEHGHEVIQFGWKDEKNIKPSTNTLPEKFDFRNGSFSRKIKNFPKFFYNHEAKEKLEKLILQEKPDIAHIHLFDNGLSVSIFQALKKHNIPIVLMLHDYRLLCNSSDFLLKGKKCEMCKASLYTNCIRYKCYQSNLLYSTMITIELLQKEYLFKLNKYVDKYLFVSEFQRNTHFHHRNYFADKSIRLYNFDPNLKKTIPTFTRGDYFLFYGRITEEKGIKTLLEIARRLPSVRFKIAGAGTLLEELKKSPLPNTEFLGFQTGVALQNLIKNAFFVVIPSECNENNPMTIIESYMHGKPVIASDIGGIPEIVLNNETGFLFPTKSADDLTEKIRQAMLLPDVEYLKLSKNARNFAEANFDPEQYYQNLLAIYESLIEGRQRN